MKRILKIDLMKRVADLQDIIRKNEREIKYLEMENTFLRERSAETQLTRGLQAAASISDAASHMVMEVTRWNK